MPDLTFKFKITLVPGMRVLTFRINATAIDKDAMDEMVSPTEPNVYEGEIKSMVIADTISMSVIGVGNPFLEGAFNVSLNGENLFKKDQPLKVGANARFRFYKNQVQLP